MAAILFLCTANACRSVMAAALLSARLTERGITVPVTSAGMLGDGRPALPEVISVLAARGIDVVGHRSRTATADDIAGADLILGLARDHVRHATVLWPDAWPYAFTLRELLRRGRVAGMRAPGEPLGAWMARVAAGRTRRDLLGSNPADDVADPTGGPMRAYRATERLLEQLTRDLVELGWPS